jgi:MFS family permease
MSGRTTPSADEAPPASKTMSFPALLAETFAVQALGTMAVLTIPALAPAVAQTLGVATAHVGYQVSVVYVSAVIASAIAGAVVGTFGPARTGQIAMLLTAVGCLAASVPHLATVILGSVLIGFSYGFINPAASELLSRHSPPNRRNLMFSIKQTGVPVGGMAAGLIGPTMTIHLSWNAVLWTVAVACLVVAVASQPGRAALDGDRAGQQSRKIFSVDALRRVLQSRNLRWLALSSFCFASVQLCAIAFLVALLVEDLGLDLVRAGAVLAAVQLAGAAGRILWGLLADAVGDGLGILLGCAALMVASFAGVAGLAGSVPLPVTIAILLVVGLSAVGWNGVFLSEVARLSPANGVSATTGAAMFFTFTGVVFGPALFALLHNALGSYVRSYLLLVALSAIGGAMVAAVRFRKRA